ncbi:hypothetical protein EUX98_g3939 [Antrodiella citrinella]|uniref:Uncharacterized protein n=1 Tax=Antrodiella citrinella TaxID=2447956 RepID=A0A4S4MVC7_9APHY|nr:hypothetical protein EUX98_g3939 [Antrodiella citrinella]
MLGEIWTLATDGDSAYRRARYLLCMAKQIDITTNLGRTLHSLKGFNCWTSRRGIVSTSDPKHVIKRFATLARNPKGILVRDTSLQCHHVLEHLQELPRMSLEEARLLLDPADKQNVPKAVKLVQALGKLQAVEENPVPSKQHRRRDLSFIAEIFGYFTLPFISTRMSLSEQIRSLIVYAHLIAVMYRKHTTHFMTGALYADSQSIVKNIIITILRLQELDPDLLYHIILEGTDRLEAIFGDCRTLDHNRNFDILQLSEKLSMALTINSIFEHYPDLDRGHRRLSLKDVEGIDHVNPRSWMGDVRVGNIDIAHEWTAGQETANRILVSYFGLSASVDFDEFFDGRENCDLLRPLGNDYVGVNLTADDDRTERREPISVLDPPVFGPEPPPVAPHVIPDHPDVEERDITFWDTSELDESDDIPEGYDLDQFFPSFPLPTTLDDHSEPQTTSEDSSSEFESEPQTPAAPAFVDFLIIDGKKYLKSSVVTSMLTSNRAQKVCLRTLRARGVTYEDLKKGNLDLDALNFTGIDPNESIKSGDIVAGLVRVRDCVCLCVYEILGFTYTKEKATLTAVSIEELAEPSSEIMVRVQIIQMEPHIPEVAVQSRGTAQTRRRAANPISQLGWIWTHEYVTFGHGKSAEKTRQDSNDRLTLRQCTLTVPGWLLHPLAPQIIPNTLSPERANTTWLVDEKQLIDLTAYAWESLEPEREDFITNYESLPQVETESLPYQKPTTAAPADDLEDAGAENNVEDQFVIPPEEIPSLVSGKKLKADDEIQCQLCEVNTPLSRMRNHVGIHILHALRGIEDDGIVIGVDPCGFCGLEGCVVQMIDSDDGNTHRILSNCEYHYTQMKYGPASRFSNATPCTNVPIHCLSCERTASGLPRTIWKYNALYHITLDHSHWLDESGRLGSIDPQLLLAMFISTQEEVSMGVARETTNAYRDAHGLQGSDDMQMLREEEDRKALQTQLSATRSSTFLSTQPPKTKRKK